MLGLRRVAVVSGVALVASLLVGSTGTAAASAGSGWNTKWVVQGLKLPRGIAFDSAGSMYVAESGLPGKGPFGFTKTGAVDRYVFDDNAARRVWSTPFISFYQNGPQGGSAEGPEGLSSVPTSCGRDEHGGDSHGDGPGGSGCKVLMIMGSSRLNIIAHGGPSVPQVGHLYELDAALGTATDRGNIGDQDYAWTKTHHLFSDFPDANPYGVLATKGGDEQAQGDDPSSNRHTYVIDAAANTVNEVTGDGKSRVIAYIPNEKPIPGLPTRDATPTCAAQGPDGALYVGTLDLVRNFGPGQGYSHVYRVDPQAGENYLTAAHLWASGLTTITSCAFDSDGNFWGTEMFKFFSPTAPPGDVVRIPFDEPTHVEHIGGGQLPFPGGIAEGAGGAMYVTVNSAGTSKATGAVVRVSRDN